MTSYWKSIVNINSPNDKNQSNHKYHQVSNTLRAPIQQLIKSKLSSATSSTKNTNNKTKTKTKNKTKNKHKNKTTRSPKTSFLPHHTNTNDHHKTNRKFSDHDSETSSLDDIDFPDAIQEQTSLINEGSTPTHRNITITRHPWSNKELSWWNHFSIGAYWFGWAFLWMPMLVIIIPHQIEYILGDDKSSQGSSMGTVFLFGSIGSLICSPVFGHLSDCSQNAMGRRRPFLMVGICVTTIGLLLMSISPPYHIYCIGFFICSCGNFITLAPYSALVPDVVPYDQRGICSGWLGACSMFGYLLGGAMSYHLEKLGFFLTFIFLTLVHAFFGWITLRFVPEIRIDTSTLGYRSIELDSDSDGEQVDHDLLLSSHKIIDVDDRDPQYKNRMNIRHNLGFFESFPFYNMDFVWLFISRFFIQMGSIIVQENLQYYLRDTKGGNFSILGVLLAKDEVQAVSVLFAPLLCGALISSIVSGIISDIYGQQRKFLVYFSGVVMSICCILFGLNRWFMFDIIISFFFGLGFGIFSAIDWAMATDVLPNRHCYGRDMGFWNLSMTLPQIIGSPIVGYLIDFFRKMNHVHLGWLAIFAFSASNFVVGTLLVRKITHVK